MGIFCIYLKTKIVEFLFTLRLGQEVACAAVSCECSLRKESEVVTRYPPYWPFMRLGSVSNSGKRRSPPGLSGSRNSLSNTVGREAAQIQESGGRDRSNFALLVGHWLVWISLFVRLTGE